MRTPRIVTFGLLIGASVLIAIGLFRNRSDDAEPQQSAATTNRGGNETTAVTPALPPNSLSLGSARRAEDLPEGYAGSETCVECHQERHETYLHSGHSRSIRDIDLDHVSHDVQLVHATSKRSYDIFSRDGQLWHREWEYFGVTGDPIRDSDPKVQLAELPVAHIMGSGTFAEAYLLRDGDYLLQSPVTWYRADQAYAMAPGYDQPIHRGVNRVIDDECLYCHAGFVSRSHPQQPRILELAIGCERCHGPSERHVSHHRSLAKADPAEAEVPTPDDARSVNPANLDRSRLESVCAQCHLNGDAVVDVAGKSIWDFRPGEELTETRVVYQADYGDTEDPFTDHFDQLRQSKCYQQSPSLTCITCHDPHHGEINLDLDELYRDQCLDCHGNDDCGQSLDLRMEQQQNRCVRCHMPAAPSSVAHSATTHHRIGIHPHQSNAERATDQTTVTLRRLQPVNPDTPDSQRLMTDLLAKAYWLLEQRGSPEKTVGLDAAELEKGILEAHRSLAQVPPRDLSILAQLAQHQSDQAQTESEFKRHLSRASQYARQALADPTIRHHAKVNALDALANQQYDSGDYEAAAVTYRQLLDLRRWAPDHYNLGLSLGKQRQYNLAEQAFRDAIQIDASYPLPYQSLSVLYRSFDPAAAARMAGIAQSLLNNTRTLMGRDAPSPPGAEPPTAAPE